MGKITIIAEPKMFTLSGLPNWIQFTGEQYGGDAEVHLTIEDANGRHIVTMHIAIIIVRRLLQANGLMQEPAIHTVRRYA